MNGATVLTRFTADTKDLDGKTKKAETSIAGLTAALVSSQLIVNGLSTSWNILKKFVGESVSAFADVEQSIGGVETLFKESSDMVIENAKYAYKTAGISANQYMEQVTSFSASLLQSTAGDTQKAGKIADMALIDMADNANKFGSSMESISNAYMGFAKQNYTINLMSA